MNKGSQGSIAGRTIKSKTAQATRVLMHCQLLTFTGASSLKLFTELELITAAYHDRVQQLGAGHGLGGPAAHV